jgi:nucleoid DNA-binding protein
MERIDGKCGCLSGFQVKNNVCKRIHFTMDIKVNKKNHLLLSFNESLLRTLNKKSVKIELENFGKLDFKLFTKNNRDFIVALKINRSIANGEKVSIELKPTIFSHRNSTLKIYHYSAFLNEFEFIQQDTQEFIKKFQTVSRSLVAAAFAFSFISNPAAAWAMIGTLQLLPYIPLSENYDDLVSKTFLISAGSFNVLPNLMIYMFSDNSSSAPYKQARSIGIDTSVFWINIGELVLPLMVIVSFWPVIFLSSRLNYKPVTKKLEKVLKNYKFSVFIRFWIQSHLDIGIYSIINLKSVKIT